MMIRKIKNTKLHRPHSFRRFKETPGTALITLLIFMSMGIIVLGAAITMSIISTQVSATLSAGNTSYYASESGPEDAVIKLLRNPDYTGQYALDVDGSNIQVDISGSGTVTITSDHLPDTSPSASRKMEIIGTWNNLVFTITQWDEIL